VRNDRDATLVVLEASDAVTRVRYEGDMMHEGEGGRAMGRARGTVTFLADRFLALDEA